jgi:hypothetical protein
LKPSTEECGVIILIFEQATMKFSIRGFLHGGAGEVCAYLNLMIVTVTNAAHEVRINFHEFFW